MPILASTSSSASTITYATLRQGITDWMHRTDINTFLPDFVRLAESDIRNDVRVRAMETEATGTVSSGSISFPTGMIELRRLVIDGYPYTYIDPIEFAELDRQDSTDYVFTAIGQTLRVLTGTSYSLVYWAPLAELLADGDSNWLLLNAMDVYLWACMKHAALYAEDTPNAQKFSDLYKGSVARVNDREERAMRAGGRMLLGTEFGGIARSSTSILNG